MHAKNVQIILHKFKQHDCTFNFLQNMCLFIINFPELILLGLSHKFQHLVSIFTPQCLLFMFLSLYARITLLLSSITFVHAPPHSCLLNYDSLQMTCACAPNRYWNTKFPASYFLIASRDNYDANFYCVKQIIRNNVLDEIK